MDFIELIKTEKVFKPVNPSDEHKLGEKKKFAPEAHDPSYCNIQVAAARVHDVIVRVHKPYIGYENKVSRENDPYQKLPESRPGWEGKMKIENHIMVLVL